MQYLVQATDCSRLYFRLSEVNTSEIVKYLVPQLQGAKVVDGTTLDGFLLTSIDCNEDLDAVLSFPSLVHKKAALRNIKEWQDNGVPFLSLMADKAIRSNSLSQGEYGTQPQSAGKALNVSFSSPLKSDFDCTVGTVGIDNRVFSESGESGLSLTQSTGSNKRANLQLSQSVNPEALPFQCEMLTQRETLSQQSVASSSGKNDAQLSQDTLSSAASSTNGGTERHKKRKADKKEKVKVLPPKKIARKTLLAMANAISNNNSTNSSSNSSSGSDSEDSDKSANVVDTMQQLASTIKPVAVHFTIHEVNRLKALVNKYSTKGDDGKSSISWERIGMELGKAAHSCHAKYQEIKPVEVEAASAAPVVATGGGVVPSTQSTATSSISRDTSDGSTSSNGSNASGSSSSSSSSSASPISSKVKPVNAVQEKSELSSALSVASSNSADTKASSKRLTLIPKERVSIDVESTPVRSTSGITKAVSAEKATPAKENVVLAGKSNTAAQSVGKGTKKNSRYNDNKTKDSVTVRPFSDTSEAVLKGHAANIGSEDSSVNWKLELRSLDFVIYLFIEEENNKPSVVGRIERWNIPKKVMACINKPTCNESLKIVCNILEYAAQDRPRLLKAYLEWGLLPCLYEIIRTNRDVNVVQHAIWCLAYVLRIDSSLRETIMLKNGMLSTILEILVDNDDHKLYLMIFDHATDLFGRNEDELQALWTEASDLERLYFAVGKSFHVPWTAKNTQKVLQKCIYFSNTLQEANIQLASETLLQSSLCSDIIYWLKSIYIERSTSKGKVKLSKNTDEEKDEDDLLLMILTLLHNLVEACEPNKPEEVERVMSCDPAPILLWIVQHEKGSKKTDFLLATLAYITDFIQYQPSLVDLFKNDVKTFIVLCSVSKADSRVEASKCLIRILQNCPTSEHNVWSTKGLVEALVKLLQDHRTTYEQNTAMEDEERHAEEDRMKQVLQLMEKVSGLEKSVERIREDRALLLDDWIEISAWVSKMYRHDREVMELLKKG